MVVQISAAEMDRAVQERMIEELLRMRSDQIIMKHLRPMGWTQELLADLYIDGLVRTLPGDTQFELDQVVSYEWIAARRAERANLAVASGLDLLLEAVRELAGEMKGLRGDLGPKVPIVVVDPLEAVLKAQAVTPPPVPLTTKGTKKA